jgi:hypothetical protein
VDDKWKILCFFALVLTISGPIGVFNVIYATAFVGWLTIWMAIKFFPGKIALEFGVPILLCIVAFIASFFHWRGRQ